MSGPCDASARAIVTLEVAGEERTKMGKEREDEDQDPSWEPGVGSLLCLYVPAPFPPASRD